MKLIYFNRPDCPDNVGISQLCESVETFLLDRSDIFKDFYITENKIVFNRGLDIYGEPILGYALIFDVPNDFNN